MKHAALLRAINVGGNNRLPMADLARIFTDAGCRDVQTYIQSGNVVFTAPARLLNKLPGKIADAIESEFGFRAPVIVRSHEELAALIKTNPFLKSNEAEKTLHVAFLSTVAQKEAIAKLDPQRCAPDRFHVLGKDMYLHMSSGLGRTKLTNAWIDSKLETISTVRNWNTVLKLHEMTCS
jgi:uncharacterized protein (DUF1697 family)